MQLGWIDFSKEDRQKELSELVYCRKAGWLESHVSVFVRKCDC